MIVDGACKHIGILIDVSIFSGLNTPRQQSTVDDPAFVHNRGADDGGSQFTTEQGYEAGMQFYPTGRPFPPRTQYEPKRYHSNVRVMIIRRGYFREMVECIMLGIRWSFKCWVMVIDVSVHYICVCFKVLCFTCV